jgi:hypothetical protein
MAEPNDDDVATDAGGDNGGGGGDENEDDLQSRADSDSDTMREQEGDDPVAEGEEVPPPRPVPSEAKAGSTKFYTICLALEKVWQNKKWDDLQKLRAILPPKYLVWLDTPSEGSDRPESIFPIFRLLIPDKDGSRQFQMAENNLAKLYAGALELSSSSRKYQKLFHFTDRDVVARSEGLGDISVVVQHVVGTTKIKQTASGFTVGAINQALDKFAMLQQQARSMKSNHDWNKVDVSGSGKKTKKAPTLLELRIQWLQRLNADTPECPGLSPLEHKWLVRIILRKMEFRVVRAYLPACRVFTLVVGLKNLMQP